MKRLFLTLKNVSLQLQSFDNKIFQDKNDSLKLTQHYTNPDIVAQTY